MSRTKWKGPFINESNLQTTKKTHLKTAVSRHATVLPKFVEETFNIYTGQKFNELHVTEEMIGRKFGEFASTRKRFVFKKKNKKNK